MQARPILPPEPNKSLCPNCQAQKSPNEAQCASCGSRVCLICSHILSPASRICPSCGWEDRKWKPPPRNSSRTRTLAPPSMPDRKIDFSCPNCKIKISSEAAQCSNCGYLIDIDRDTSSVDTVVPETRAPSPLHRSGQPLITHERIAAKSDVKVGYSCPHCGEKVNPGSDRCLNCGHMGPMQHNIGQQYPTTPLKVASPVPPVRQQSPPAQQFQPIPEVAQGRSCPQCGQEISMDSRICPYCNATIGSRRPTPPLHAVSTTERAQANVFHPVTPTPATVPPMYRGEIATPKVASFPLRGESAAPKVASFPLPGKPIAEKDTREKKRRREYRGKRGGFPIGLLAAIIVVAAALIGMVVFVASQEFKPPETSPEVENAFSIEDISTTSVTENGVVVTWTTEVPATSQVQLCEGEILCLPWTDVDNELVTSHSVTVSDLKPGTQYHVTVRSLDADGNETISDEDVTFTTTGESASSAFAISGVSVININETSATIKWTTNEAATSKIEYGKTTSYGTQSVDNNLATNHTIVLSNLETETNYYYKIICTDADGNETVYEQGQAFATSAHITVGINIGNRAPEIELNQLGGGTVKLSDLRGKIVIVNFWYTTCGPCIAEMPDIEDVYSTWSGQDQLVVLSVNRGDTSTAVQDFVNTHQLTFPVLLDPDQSTNSKYLVTSWPTTYFIDTEGIVRDYKEGSFVDKDEILSKLESVSQ